MSPSELQAHVARSNDRIRSAATGASSLVLLAVAAVAGGYWLHRIEPRLAETVAVFAVMGGAIMVAALVFLRWQRDEILDDIVLHGFRHVHRQAVARRASELVSLARRRQMADTLDQFVEAAVARRRTPVPVHRGALIELRPQVTELSAILRSDEVELDPAGMVLLHRFVTDGTVSPLFRTTAPPSEVERELARIRSTLGQDRLAA